MEDAFAVLAGDHEEIRQALDELEKGPTAASGATEDQLMLRTIMTEELAAETARHEEIELSCLCPAVRRHVADGDRLADRVVCGGLELAALLAELAALDAARPGFEDVLGQLTAAVREHFDFEEGQVWPRLRPALVPKAAAELNRAILRARLSGPLTVPGPRAAAPGESARHRSFG